MNDYLDASAVVPLLIPERYSQLMIGFVDDNRAQVSDFVVAEVSSAISRLVRMRAIDAVMGGEVLGNFDDWVAATPAPVEVEGDDIRQATALVRQFELKLRAPDALHLTICRRIDARLVTLDTNLADAARAVGVACINPAEISA
ncbi:hypothetical protein BH10PSE1_BH10PSE1_02810 [soil metagenome]